MPRTLEGQITMEKTPSYFITKEAPRRVFSMSRHTKLIVVVRDPVTRAVSDYTQTLSKSPGLPSFQNLAFRNATTGLIDTSWSAVRIGIYAKHLETWLRFFPLSRFLFVSGERLVTDPAGEMGRVQDFLGLKRVQLQGNRAKSTSDSQWAMGQRLDSEVYDEDGNSLLSLDYDRDQVDVRNPPAVADDVYTLYYPPEKR
ncbi:hypothetical protein F2P81_021857 [Scophthalmus maximus]|uniref:Sulfotransferase n=1 Tax=Scophthalmus maximus TaxID=52904 RepID=A0A6A4RQP4_SCOMX|nr:hypothetical protein F2P81_021857 [Scophthalmus maximus]